MHDIDLGPSSVGGLGATVRTPTWAEPTFGEGITSGYDHVVIAGKGIQTATIVTDQEENMIEDCWDVDEIYDGSRLAGTIVLTKAMDGMTIFVPDRVEEDFY